MVGWLHRFNGHELGQTLGASEGQGSLVWGSPWGHKELVMTWRLNNNLNRRFFKEDTQIANKFMKRSSTSVIIKENQNIVRYHFTPIRMATIKNKHTHSLGRMCRHWKMQNSTTVMKNGIEVPQNVKKKNKNRNSAIQLLGI